MSNDSYHFIRWELSAAGPITSTSGAWVKYEDFELLLRRCERLENDLLNEEAKSTRKSLLVDDLGFQNTALRNRLEELKSPRLSSGT